MPVLVAQAELLEFQYWRLAWVSWKVTVWLAPGWRLTRAKPSSCLGGSPDAAGSVMYSWAMSAPARVPVLVTVAVTVAAPPAVRGLTDRLLKENVV